MTLKIAIIGGTGKMGSLFSKALMERGHEVIISGRETQITPIEAAKKGDIVIICVPISATEETIKLISPFVRKDSILTDFTSIKLMPCKVMEKYSNSNVIGGHPVFGPNVELRNQPFIICPVKATKECIEKYKKILESLGLNIIQMTPEEHDKEMAIVQCMNQFDNLAFANALKKLNFNAGKKELFSPAFTLKINMIERMLAQPPYLYAEIETYNPYAREYAKIFEEAMLEIKEDIDSNNSKILEEKIAGMQEHFSKTKEKIDYSTETEKPTISDASNSEHKIAVLGPEYSYGHILSKTAYPKSEFVLCNNIEEIFRLVSEDKIIFGIAPIENMLNGTVRESVFSLKKYKVKINKLFHLPIHHCLASKSYEFSKIASHQQALAQCSSYLRKFEGEKELLETPSTSKAMEIASTNKDYAAIGSIEAAKHYNLKIIDKNIEDDHKNLTSFILISKKENIERLKGNIRTSILISPDKDKPGLLYELLSIFKKHNINLTKIESIPTGNRIGEYIFYIEFNGNLENEDIKQAIDILKSLHEVYSLGSYELKDIE